MKYFSLNYKQILLISGVLPLVNLVFPLPVFIKIIFTFFYFLIFGYTLGKYFLEESFFWQVFLGTLSLIGGVVIILSVIYWFYQIDRVVLGAILFLLAFLVYILSFNYPPISFSFSFLEFKTKKIKDNFLDFFKKPLSWVFVAVIMGDVTLYILLFLKRTGETIISPWIYLGVGFLALFFLTTLSLFIFVSRDNLKLSLLGLVLHYGVLFSVALILYKHGFGFDPFVHQSTEKWIANKGFITPKKPYYIGQYMLVVAAHFLSGAAISTIDWLLVPTFASLILPLSTYFVLKDYINKTKLLKGLVLVPIVILSFFTTTTPTNIALLFALLCGNWLWYINNKKRLERYVPGGIFALASAAIHPIIGIPTVTIYTGAIIFNCYAQKNKTLTLSIYTGILIFSLPAVLSSYVFYSDIGRITNPINNIKWFLNLFSTPHWYKFKGANIFWRSLYYYKKLILPTATLVGLGGLWYVYKRHKKRIGIFLLSTVVGLFISSFLISTSIDISNVISYEKGKFGGRLLNLIILLLIPGFVIEYQNIANRIKSVRYHKLIPVILSVLITVSFYFTYPTRDPVSKYTGYNVRSSDLKAVRFIDKINENKNYIVITNQMVGAAALHEFGFAKYFKLPDGSEQYFYSIPTGAKLYDEFFGKMVYQKPRRKWMVRAMEFVGVKKAYFVHTDYWYPAAEIRDQAKKYADKWWEFGKGEVWVYEYKK